MSEEDIIHILKEIFPGLEEDSYLDLEDAVNESDELSGMEAEELAAALSKELAKLCKYSNAVYENTCEDLKDNGFLTTAEYKEIKDFASVDIIGLAVKTAFPKCSEKVRNIIASWYEEEADTTSFDDPDEYADFIKEDIEDMLDAGPDEDVIKELVKKGYIDEGWLDGLEEDDL